MKQKPKTRAKPRRVAKKRQYSDQQKAWALAALAANGGLLVQTADQLGIPLTTLEHWKNGENIHPDIPRIGREKKSELADMLRGYIWRTLMLTTDADIKSIPPHMRWVPVGIAAEKSQLLDGEATGITGKQEMSDDEFAERLEALARRLQARRDGTGGQGRVQILDGSNAAPTPVEAIPGQPTGNGVQQSGG